MKQPTLFPAPPAKCDACGTTRPNLCAYDANRAHGLTHPKDRRPAQCINHPQDRQGIPY